MLRSISVAYLLIFALAADASEPLVTLANGKLNYRTVENGDRIPDFSDCGYKGGGIPIPLAKVKATLTPRPSGDDTERIQQAIDKLGSGNSAEAVLLRAGTYRVEGTLYFRRSGAVLRGEGQNAGGTVIIATGTKKRSLISIGSGSPGREIAGSAVEIADKRVPVGARTLRVAAQNKFKPGDEVVVVRRANTDWISALGTDKLSRGPSDKVKNWSPDGYTLRFERTVTAASGNSVTVDAPITCAIEEQFGGGYICRTEPDGRIHNVGIESLRMVSEYEKGKESQDEAHAWDGIKIGALRDGWVRNVTAVHFGYSCVNISSKGKRITVQDCACLDPVSQITGGRRYSFALAGQLCLFQRCYTRGGRHDYVMHARVPGPNVFLDCVADNTHSDSGPHHRWATGTLYDNVACGALNVQNRRRSGTGHGWAGANMVFWNCRARSIDCQRPPTANNYCIGCTGNIKGSGHMESKGRHVEPRSLYLRQLYDRKGIGAVKSVSFKEQLEGSVDDMVRTHLSK